MLLILLLCSCGPGLSRATVTPSPNIEAGEYAVYSALIRQNPIGYHLGASIVVREQTVADLDMFERTLENVHTLPASLVDSYRSRNAASYTLDPNLDIEQDYSMLPQAEFEQIFLHRKGSVWTTFQEAYPEAGGMIIFSRVGFDEKGEKAWQSLGFAVGTCAARAGSTSWSGRMGAGRCKRN